MADPKRDEVSVLGTLAEGVVGSGNRRGLVTIEAAGIEIDWWVGADDAWRIPSDGDVHTVRPGIAPAIDARVRVPSGEVVMQAYAVAGERAPLVITEAENASGGPLVVAWVVRAAPGYRIGRVAIEGTTLLIDERARVELPRVPLRWAVASRSVGVRDAVLGGQASSGAFEPVITRRGDLEVAVLFPVAHRTRTRIAATIAGTDVTPATVARLPTYADVERGWEAALDVGMQVEIPDPALQGVLDAARATLLLGTASVRSGRRDRRVTDAAAAWALGSAAPSSRGLGGRGRGVGRARGSAADVPIGELASRWSTVRAGADGAGTAPGAAAEWLMLMRDALFTVDSDGVDLLPYLPLEWLGQPVAVHDAPTAAGPVSFAVRWHGGRPALLWEVPDGLRVRAPGLDPAWEAIGHAGEALLGEIDPTRLLPLGTKADGAAPGGVVIDEPESFS